LNWIFVSQAAKQYAKLVNRLSRLDDSLSFPKSLHRITSFNIHFIQQCVEVGCNRLLYEFVRWQV